MFAEIVVARGYYTHGTATTRRLVSLAEGALVVLDTLIPDAGANGWTAGPSFAVVNGPNTPGTAGATMRPNRTEGGPYWQAQP